MDKLFGIIDYIQRIVDIEEVSIYTRAFIIKLYKYKRLKSL